jgi:hypothetical protein
MAEQGKETSSTPIPRNSAGREVLEATLMAASSLVPILGGPFSVVLGSALQGAYQRRLLTWLENLAAALDSLSDDVEGMRTSEMLDDDVFIDTALRAARAAALTASEEKLDALRSAVLNAALPGAPKEDQQQIYIAYVEILTASHLRLLSLLNDPQGYTNALGLPWPDMMMGGHSGTVERAFPDWNRSFYDQLVRDLHSRGLIGTDSLHTTVSGNGLRQSLTTESGKSFLAFITSPEGSAIVEFE